MAIMKGYVPAPSPEWYTPLKYVLLVKQVLGEIDLDPASCFVANETVGAASYYDVITNGLAHNWYGRVFLNPPYGKIDNVSQQEKWTCKLIYEYVVGHVTEGICLVNSSDSSTVWYQRLMRYPHCLTDHRIIYNRFGVKGTRNRAMCGSVFVYFGERKHRFFEAFHDVGVCFDKAVSFPGDRNIRLLLPDMA